MIKYTSAKGLHSKRYRYWFQAHPNLVLTYNGNRVGDEDNQQPEGFLPGQSVYLIVTDRRQKKESSNQRSALYSTFCSCVLVYLRITSTEIQKICQRKNGKFRLMELHEVFSRIHSWLVIISNAWYYCSFFVSRFYCKPILQ